MFQNCGKVFTKHWNFANHYRAHLKIKPFKCHVCDKSFTQKGNLKKHYEIHQKSQQWMNFPY